MSDPLFLPVTKNLLAIADSKSNFKMFFGFPGGAVVENLPANAGHRGSSPGLGRSHMLQSS